MFWDLTSSKLITVAQRYRNKCPPELCVTAEAVPAERIPPPPLFLDKYGGMPLPRVQVRACVRACAGLFGTAVVSPLGSEIELSILGISMPAE